MYLLKETRSLDEDPVRAISPMTSLIESSRMRCSIGFQERKDHFESVHHSSPSDGDLLEVGFVRVVVVRVQVAVECWRHWIEAVVCDGNGLCILEFGEGLHVETEVGVWEVALRGP